VGGVLGGFDMLHAAFVEMDRDYYACERGYLDLECDIGIENLT
jgi:hypothetical protein